MDQCWAAKARLVRQLLQYYGQDGLRVPIRYSVSFRCIGGIVSSCFLMPPNIIFYQLCSSKLWTTKSQSYRFKPHIHNSTTVFIIVCLLFAGRSIRSLRLYWSCPHWNGCMVGSFVRWWEIIIKHSYYCCTLFFCCLQKKTPSGALAPFLAFLAPAPPTLRAFPVPSALCLCPVPVRMD